MATEMKFAKAVLALFIMNCIFFTGCYFLYKVSIASVGVPGDVLFISLSDLVQGALDARHLPHWYSNCGSGDTSRHVSSSNRIRH